MIKYIYRITNEAFFIYKISNRGIRLHMVGKSFEKGNYSPEFKRAIKKCDIDIKDLPYWSTTDSYDAMCVRLIHRKEELKSRFPRQAWEDVEYSYNTSDKGLKRIENRAKLMNLIVKEKVSNELEDLITDLI